MILVERGEGLETKAIKTSYVTLIFKLRFIFSHNSIVAYRWNSIYHVWQCESTNWKYSWSWRRWDLCDSQVKHILKSPYIRIPKPMCVIAILTMSGGSWFARLSEHSDWFLRNASSMLFLTYGRELPFLSVTFQVDCAEEGLWKAASFTGRYSKQASGDDIPGWERTELAWEHHLSNE